MLERPTYLVLDLPQRIAARVCALRRRYNVAMSQLPAEITIAGSSRPWAADSRAGVHGGLPFDRTRSIAAAPDSGSVRADLKISRCASVLACAARPSSV